MKRVTAILVASFLVLLFPLAADFCASDAFASPAEDSWNVNLIGRWGWTLGGDCAAVACHGDTVYFINGRYVNVVDFSNPEVPVEIGKVSIQSSEENIFIN